MNRPVYINGVTLWHDYQPVPGKGKFVVLRSKQTGERFFSNNTGEYEADWYDLLKVTDSIEEAQTILFGRPIRSSSSPLHRSAP